MRPVAVLLLLVQLLGAGSLSLVHAWDLDRTAAAVVVADPSAPPPPFHEHADCHACKLAGLHALAASEPPAPGDDATRPAPGPVRSVDTPARAFRPGGGGSRAPPA